MKLSDFRKLEELIQQQDFNRSFKNINKLMFFLSIFGHFSSIFLAYFLVSKILSGAITNTTATTTLTRTVATGKWSFVWGESVFYRVWLLVNLVLVII
jgi:hypothetical protein